MAKTNRPRRSMLYMPGANTRALDKARSLAADALILDLEDSCAPDAKDAARANVVAALAEGGYGNRELIMRVNALTTPWGHADLVAAAKCGADGVLIPKVDGAEGVRQAEAVLRDAGAPDDLKLWVMMETPLAILRAEEVAGATPRLAGLVLGTSDLAKDLHCAHTPERLPFLASLSLCILAARAFDLAVMDGVHLDLDDEEGFARVCRQGAELGMDGKTLIHPKQLAAANEAFGPSEADIAKAEKIIAAHQAATAEGKGVVVVDGKLVENLHVVGARRLLDMAEQIKTLG
ncbi:CoA ester lyase [uncultured Tistrella sp.]|jgi:citrate lyase subunit beta/citryl-CoA lyase|uniref:HpcH/HpaI aldolase/citrate lyase family protein n=1 Tax=Tistrella mobilis TaxID=171437 RepID=UPI000C09030C|nr:CoA ester lyase [uncultured Tistrella sp.]MAM75775.1 CoA ester lyase [Tistrella sp.]